MAGSAWRVAVTRDDKADDPVRRSLEHAGFIPLSCPVLIEGPAPNPAGLEAAARTLESFDWVICASARAVHAITAARGAAWPAAIKTAATGSVTAAAIRAAGAGEPIVADTFTAKALWARLAPLDTWRNRRVLVATIPGGRREIIDGLRAEGADLTEVDAYTMTPRPSEDIRKDWALADPDAVIIGSADTARHLVSAVGIDAMHELEAIVPIGPTTAQALKILGLNADPPAEATFAAAAAHLAWLRNQT